MNEPKLDELCEKAVRAAADAVLRKHDESLRAQAALAEQHATEAENVSDDLLIENEALRKEAERLNRWILRIATVAENGDNAIIGLLCEQATEGLAADGEITEKLDRFHELQRIVDRYERGLNRLDPRQGFTVLATWPWALSAEQCAVAHILVNRLTQIAENLLDGKEWDGSKL